MTCRANIGISKLVLAGVLAVGFTVSLLALPAASGPFTGALDTPVAEGAQRGCPRVLVLGDRGADVAELQRRLNRVFRNIDSQSAFRESPIVVDGVYGRRTESRVVAFQRIISDLDDAVVGPETWSALGAC